MDFREWIPVLRVLVLIFGCGVTAQTPEFLFHPLSINSTDGTTVEFNCTVDNNPTVFVFLVNGTDVSSDDVEKGFVELPVDDLGNGMRRARLLVTASVADNNNTQIVCQAIGNGMIVDSNTATLLVQGQLSLVSGLTPFIDSSTINISWSPPFTLPGTDITGYNISVTNNGTTTNYFTSDSYYVLLLTDYTVSSCVLNVSISGYNGLDGLIDLITVPSFQPTAPVFVNVSENLSVVANVDVVEECTDFYSSVNLRLSSDNSQTVISSDFMVNDSREDLIEMFATVEEDSLYTLTVSFTFAGYQVENYFTFDTYGVSLVTGVPQVGNGIVSIICQFNSFSTDTGCTVQLVLQGTSTVLYTATFNRSGSIAEGSIRVMSGGVYDILAFDEGSTVVAASLLGVSIAGPRLTTTTITTSTNRRTSTETSTQSISRVPPTSNIRPTPTVGRSSDMLTNVYVGVPVGAVILGLLIITVLLISCFIWKKKKHHHILALGKDRVNSSEAFVASSDFDGRSPTNVEPPKDVTYSVPNKKPTNNNTTLVYAELSEIRNKNGSTSLPPKKDNSKVVYSDLLIKGQPPPPPYEPIRPGVTVIPPKEPEIVEFFFNHNDNDDTHGSGKDSNKYTDPAMGGNDPTQYPPPPSERAPSPPTEDTSNQPPPIPSRTQLSHNNRLPDVVRHNNHQYTEEGYTDESLNPAREEFRNLKGDAQFSGSGMYRNTPTATFL